jgi:prevent-host-death family protein
MAAPERGVGGKPAVKIAQAKAHFSELVKRAKAGEEIVILCGNEPIARLAPLEPRPKRRAGRLRHLMSDADWRALIMSVETPMSADELAEADGEPLFGETGRR